MTPERWQQITELFDVVLEREPRERQGFLAEVCNGDEDLQAEVASLLSSDQEAGSFISDPVLGLKTSVVSQSIEASKGKAVTDENLTGQVLGHYQILEKLGEGGMGVVCGFIPLG